MAAALYQRQSVFQPSPLDEEDALILSNDDKRSSYATIEVPSTVKSIYSSFVTALKLAVLITMLLVGYTIRSMFLGATKRRGYGPFMLCLFAFPLVMVQPVLQVLQSLHYYNSYAPMTKLINVISWMGLIQMSTASMWNASLDQSVLAWWKQRQLMSSPLPSPRYMPNKPVTVVEEEECGT
ncbi:hypothetical protein H310_12760 [Aphanomyces invadans]|uniref:Uncharacterized protein n=1 Tax=Aphanomyces invadans TaxID=157072 RepID=A0A024THT2_9STRA|nr:hypothetical protein H310_12760 [Aphanomyces invadans]ETV93151.1 hypothetical protein H310_12760 [Aphanomyces invadans]|eukprot:XP_008878173.1 hypothetical protein H310_12760 [Aphanomyces invadans]